MKLAAEEHAESIGALEQISLEVKVLRSLCDDSKSASILAAIAPNKMSSSKPQRRRYFALLYFRSGVLVEYGGRKGGARSWLCRRLGAVAEPVDPHMQSVSSLKQGPLSFLWFLFLNFEFEFFS